MFWKIRGKRREMVRAVRRSSTAIKTMPWLRLKRAGYSPKPCLPNLDLICSVGGHPQRLCQLHTKHNLITPHAQAHGAVERRAPHNGKFGSGHQAQAGKEIGRAHV